MQDRCTVCAKSTIGSEIILDAPDGTAIWRLKWKFVSIRLETVLVSICLEIVLILTLDRCTVCTEHTIGLEIIMDAPDGTPI